MARGAYALAVEIDGTAETLPVGETRIQSGETIVFDSELSQNITASTQPRMSWADHPSNLTAPSVPAGPRDPTP